ncbi:MAG: PadR family transcriptional regulator [Chloroflexi bacterium]|nr:PadR family transcriptional regulator [Chloroflexota bacterium]
MPGNDLPRTSYAVLGLLGFGEMSGYDLKQFADKSISHFYWAPAKSQVYSELRRLSVHGYVAQREVEQEKRPDKRIYSITDAGRQTLRGWLESSDLGPEVTKSPTVLRTFLGAGMAPSILIDRLKEYADSVRVGRMGLEKSLKECESSPDGFFPALTIRCGLAHASVSIDWAEATIAEIEAKVKDGADDSGIDRMPRPPVSNPGPGRP